MNRIRQWVRETHISKVIDSLIVLVMAMILLFITAPRVFPESNKAALYAPCIEESVLSTITDENVTSILDVYTAAYDSCGELVGYIYPENTEIENKFLVLAAVSSYYHDAFWGATILLQECMDKKARNAYDTL